MSDPLTLFLKAVADSTRLNILGLLAQRPHSVDELAAILDLKAPTISHHLKKLQTVGLVDSHSHQYYNIYSLLSDKLREYAALLALPHLVARVQKIEGVKQEAFAANALARWIQDQKLVGLPAQVKQREIVLRWLVEKFAVDRRYDWCQVDEVLMQWVDWSDPHRLDTTSVQRELVDSQLLNRLPDERWYWRADSPCVQQPNFSPEALPIAETPDLLRYTAVRATLRAKEPTGVYANLREPLNEKDSRRELQELALRIRTGKVKKQGEIDAIIRKHHPGNPDEIRAALVEQGLIDRPESE